MAGRKTKLTEECQKKMVTLLAIGCTRKAACGCAGISQDSLARYLRNADFADAITGAEAEAAAKMTRVLTKAAERDWRAALAWLSRRRPEDWGNRLRVSTASDADLLREAQAILDRQKLKVS